MTINLPKGSNAVISASGQDGIVVHLDWDAPDNYELDASAFLLNADGAVLNDDAMIFFNQPTSPDDAVHYHSARQLFTLDLKKLNPAVKKIAFTLTLYEGIERKQTFKNLNQAAIQVFKDKQELVRYELSGQELNQETALIFAELYLNKGQWKFRAVGQGFNGGLAALCLHFGVSVEDEKQTVTANVTESGKSAPANSNAASSEQKLKNAPTLLSLAKQARVVLEKVNLIQHKAKVAICLDISTSMADLYNSGKIQRLTEKFLALGCQFDADRKLDLFLFAEKAYHAEEIGVDNFAGFTERLLNRYPLEGGSCYGKVMKLIRNFYFPLQISADKPLVSKADVPVYVLFVTAGDTTDLEETKRQIKGSSYEPLFWQFMAIAKTEKTPESTEFSFLESLDSLPKRHIDNTGFFSVEDHEEISDAQLYQLLMAKYPHWLKLAQEKQMLG